MSGTALEAPPAALGAPLHHLAPLETKRAPHAPAREAAEAILPALVPRVVAVEIPPVHLRRRTPYVAVRMALGPLELVLGVVLPRHGSLALRVPPSILGAPAVTAPPALLAEIEALALEAIRADLAACLHLNSHRRERFEGELRP